MPRPTSHTSRPAPRKPPRPAPPDLFQIVIECQTEAQQRDLFDRLRREGLKLRLLVL